MSWRLKERHSDSVIHVSPFVGASALDSGADTVAIITKRSEEPASFHSLQRLCVRPAGYCSWTKAIPEVGALPVFTAAMVLSLLPYAYLSALLCPRLSAPGWLWVASRSTNRKPPFVKTNLPLSSFTPPSTMASFLLWRSGMKKKKKKQMKWGWRRRTSTAATIGRALATADANRSTTSETPSDRRPWRSGDWWGGWVEDKMMGGRGWRRTEEGTAVMDWSGAWLVWVTEEDGENGSEGAAPAHKETGTSGRRTSCSERCWELGWPTCTLARPLS